MPAFRSLITVLRWFLGIVLSGLVLFGLLLLVLAQFKSVRYVYLEPFQATGAISAALFIAAFVSALVPLLLVRDPNRRYPAMLAVAGPLILAVPCVGVYRFDSQPVEQLSVVAVSPDGTAEIALSYQDGESSGSWTLRTRSRAGLLSKYAVWPLGYFCNSRPVAVSFTSPTAVTVRLDTGQTLALTIDATTLEPPDVFNDCVGDQG